MYKILHYETINFSEDINVTKTSAWKEWIICLYWYCLDKGLRFKPAVFNGCYDIMMMSIDINSIATLIIHGAYYCFISKISKSELIIFLKKC